MDIDSSRFKEFILFHVRRNIVNLYKKEINLIEDLLQEHRTMLAKIKSKTSEEFIKNIDFFTEDKYNYLRKRILDMGNECTRDLEKLFEQIEVNLKNETEVKEEGASIFKSVKIEGGIGKNLKVKGKII
jgi:hypothetical protein